MFPEEDFEPRRAEHGAGAIFFLALLQVLFDAERALLPPDPMWQLDLLEEELALRAARDGDRRRLMRAAELVRKLRGAAKLNVNGGQLSGWLCAGMFDAPR